MKSRINELQQLVNSEKSTEELKFEAERNIKLLEDEMKVLEERFDLLTTIVDGKSVASLQWWMDAVNNLLFQRRKLTLVDATSSLATSSDQDEVVCCDEDEEDSCKACQDGQNI